MCHDWDYVAVYSRVAGYGFTVMAQVYGFMVMVFEAICVLFPKLLKRKILLTLLVYSTPKKCMFLFLLSLTFWFS